MSNLEKKKQREKEAKKKVLARREEMRRQAKAKRKLDQEASSYVARKKPITNAEFYREKALKDMEICDQIEHNIEILKALQEAEVAEKKARRLELQQKETLTSLEQAELEFLECIEETVEELENPRGEVSNQVIGNISENV